MAGDAEAKRTFTRRALFLGGVQVAAGVLLTGRMAWLALAENEKYALASEANRVDLRLIPPRRGWIVDAAGLPLAENRPAYGVELIPALAGDIEAALATIGAIVPLAAEDRARINTDIAARPKSVPVSVATDIGWEAYAALNLRLADMAGLQPVRSFVRSYPQGSAFGHVLGYVGPPTAEQFRESRDALLLFPGFRIGKDGVEKALEPVLRGEAGARRVEVNARGRIIRDLDTRPDTPGKAVRLTLDRGLQAHAAARVGDGSASIVVIDCQTGDIKCLLSNPAFDPNVFSNRIPSALWKALQASDHKPLLNKSLQGLYVPGSTYKPVTALAALGAGVPPSDSVVCNGRYRMGSNTWHCHGRHGVVDMRRAIAKSCNVYFYTMARRIGNDAVAAMARTMGLGQRFELPMPSQRRGTIPDEAWKLQRFGKPWTAAETLNSCIGQGDVQVNPLQLAVMTARLASGMMVLPRLLADAPAVAFEPLPLPADQLAVVRQGMFDVVNGPGGTARASRLRLADVAMGGKTGTAQVRRITAAERRRGVIRNEALPWKLRDHALFIGFAPADAPRYAISVVAEHGGSGAGAAAPLARDVLTFLFDRERAEKDLAATITERERKARAAARAAEAAAAAAAATSAAPDDDEDRAGGPG
ncbi:penicillin-binding protein 2 [Sandaracinobacteroides saxicola]|uniref:Penicillin-binding protein 2 n=1 Tax=Sandaracinobacteroides saxicola TaxID=2759707 RepID=A0A7G5IGF1_9SPHN|nr:penicillin-binding protein 2 [Sandaracinobacteroides saxicola]QMW22443.1 penicillin-binding protein 2 [Sandaracinobacteroides saxicola]